MGRPKGSKNKKITKETVSPVVPVAQPIAPATRQFIINNVNSIPMEELVRQSGLTQAQIEEILMSQEPVDSTDEFKRNNIGFIVGKGTAQLTPGGAIKHNTLNNNAGKSKAQLLKEQYGNDITITEKFEQNG